MAGPGKPTPKPEPKTPKRNPMDLIYGRLFMAFERAASQ